MNCLLFSVIVQYKVMELYELFITQKYNGIGLVFGMHKTSSGCSEVSSRLLSSNLLEV